MAQRVFKPDYIDGGVHDFIFSGKTDSKRVIRFFIPAETILELADLLKVAGSPGHAIWHRQSKTPTPCDMCHKF